LSLLALFAPARRPPAPSSARRPSAPPSLSTSPTPRSSRASWLVRVAVRSPFLYSSPFFLLTFSLFFPTDECVDTTQALDSCGGCASTGEGQDCTAIRGSAGVGCEASKCVIFSCQSGWKLALDGSKCIRARSHHGSSNSTSAKRHLAGRHHAAHHSTI
jgi:hypothetical protein